MAWVFLLVAALFEIVFALSMKSAQGFTRPWPSLLVVVAAIAGIYFLTLSLREFERLAADVDALLTEARCVP